MCRYKTHTHTLASKSNIGAVFETRNWTGSLYWTLVALTLTFKFEYPMENLRMLENDFIHRRHKRNSRIFSFVSDLAFSVNCHYFFFVEIYLIDFYVFDRFCLTRLSVQGVLRSYLLTWIICITILSSIHFRRHFTCRSLSFYVFLLVPFVLASVAVVLEHTTTAIRLTERLFEQMFHILA